MLPCHPFPLLLSLPDACLHCRHLGWKSKLSGKAVTVVNFPPALAQEGTSQRGRTKQSHSTWAIKKVKNKELIRFTSLYSFFSFHPSGKSVQSIAGFSCVKQCHRCLTSHLLLLVSLAKASSILTFILLDHRMSCQTIFLYPDLLLTHHFSQYFYTIFIKCSSIINTLFQLYSPFMTPRRLSSLSFFFLCGGCRIHIGSGDEWVNERMNEWAIMVFLKSDKVRCHGTLSDVFKILMHENDLMVN